MTRLFDAPRRLVRYVWRSPDGAEMGMRGVYREVVPNERIVNTESFDDPWYEGEAVGTVVFVGQGGKTTVTTTVLYASQEVRDGVLKSPRGAGARCELRQACRAAGVAGHLAADLGPGG